MSKGIPSGKARGVVVKVVVQLEDGAGVGVRAPERVRAPACTPGFFDGGRPRLQPQIRPRTRLRGEMLVGAGDLVRGEIVYWS